MLTGEDWNNVMYTAIRSKGGREGGGAIYAVYFVILLLCGDWTLLNVFLAIACDSLDQAAELTAAEEAEKERQVRNMSYCIEWRNNISIWFITHDIVSIYTET